MANNLKYNKYEKAVYKMNIDCYRMGSLDGVFVADKELVAMLIESEMPIYFGEVLGKHSEVVCPIEANDIKEVSDDEKVVSIIEEHKLESGFDPFSYSICLGEFDKLTDEDRQKWDDEDFDDWTFEDWAKYKHGYKGE